VGVQRVQATMAEGSGGRPSYSVGQVCAGVDVVSEGREAKERGCRRGCRDQNHRMTAHPLWFLWFMLTLVLTLGSAAAGAAEGPAQQSRLARRCFLGCGTAALRWQAGGLGGRAGQASPGPRRQDVTIAGRTTRAHRDNGGCPAVRAGPPLGIWASGHLCRGVGASSWTTKTAQEAAPPGLLHHDPFDNPEY